MTQRVFVAVLAAAACLASGYSRAQLPVAPLSAGVHLIRAEVAATFDTRASGLMFRESLGANEGMLFVFPRSERHCMWMKNTLIPLAVAFLDERGKIVSISEMRPQTETSHCAAAPAKYALEMSKGWFAARNIAAGAVIAGMEKIPPAH